MYVCMYVCIYACMYTWEISNIKRNECEQIMIVLWNHQRLKGKDTGSCMNLSWTDGLAGSTASIQ